MTPRVAARPWWHWLGISLAVIALDLASKAWIVAAFKEGDELPLTSFMSLVLAYNSGAAFSFLAEADGWQRWFFAVIAIVASGVLLWMLKRGGSGLLCAGLALILGGALGNLWDRVMLGHVVDFLLLHYRGWSWPAFNVADSAISVGAVLLIIDSFRPHDRAAERAASGGKP
jgi:signal peptidase II